MFKTEFIVANVAFFVKVISEKNAAAPVARGPVPCECPVQTKNACSTETWTFLETIDAWRGTGPRTTVKGDGFLFLTVARGPVLRAARLSEAG